MDILGPNFLNCRRYKSRNPTNSVTQLTMGVFLRGFCLLFLAVVTVSAEPAQRSGDEDLPRYVVFQGLDADPEEVAEWNVGFASPFNVFFGPKPYILGWVGEAGFGPEGEDEEDIEGEIEGEEGEEEGEEVEGEDPEEEEPDYDYEKA